MFICHALMCTMYINSYIRCFSFHSLWFHPPPLFIPISHTRHHTIKKHWNNIKLQTYFPNSISLYDEPYSRVLFFFLQIVVDEAYFCWCWRYTKILYWKYICLMFIPFKVHTFEKFMPLKLYSPTHSLSLSLMHARSLALSLWFYFISFFFLHMKITPFNTVQYKDTINIATY